MFIDILPTNLAAWVSLLGACFIGIMIGKWMRDRRYTPMAGSESVNRMENNHQGKRVSKEARLNARRDLK